MKQTDDKSKNDNNKLCKNNVDNIASKLTTIYEGARVKTSIGILALDRLKVGHLIALEKINNSQSDPPTSFRKYLPKIAYLLNFLNDTEEKTPLNSALVEQLSNNDIEKIAEAYISVLELEQDKDDQKKESLFKDSDEKATVYVDQLLRNKYSRFGESIKISYPSDKIFDQIRKSSSDLTKTLSHFDQILTNNIITDENLPIDANLTNLISDHHTKKEKERAEELEMIRLTGKMTAESAIILRDLAVVASTLLERLDERAMKSDKDTKSQFSIAFWTLIVTACISLVSLIFTILNYW